MHGWSVHAPGNDSSPVYSLVVDGSRVFGANESRGFVFDFGMGVKEGTYPPLPVPSSRSVGVGVMRARRGHGRGSGGGFLNGVPHGHFGNLSLDPLERRDENGRPGVYVTKYGHYPGRG